MLLPENQVIERSLARFPAGNVLLVDALQDQAITEFGAQRPDINWFAYTPYADTKDYLTKYNVALAPWLTDEFNNTKFDAVVIYYPKTKQRFDYYLSNISQHLNDNATIYIVGEKKGGVKSCDKAKTSFAFNPKKIDSARHCMLYVAPFTGTPCNKTMDDWFSSFTIDYQLLGEQHSVEIFSLPGVFSNTQLDKGTELLLTQLPKLTGSGLDFGCGCGVISVVLAKHFNATMAAVDVDSLAVACTNKALQHYQFNGKAYCNNGINNFTVSSKLDFIVTNPPFHTGLKTDYGITESLLKKAKSLLKSKYQMWMVANSFLPYQPMFKQYLAPATTIENNKKFAVYKVASSN